MAKRTYIKNAVKNRIYRADAKDLGLTNTKKPHDVVVVSVNKRSKRCRVKTITSLERKITSNGSSKNVFINNKLNDVRAGRIIVIPKRDINTHHLSGINNKILTVRTNKLYKSTTGTRFPRRFKHLINRRK